MLNFIQWLLTVTAVCSLSACTGNTNAAAAPTNTLAPVDSAVAQQMAAAPATLTMAFVGDIMMGTTFPDSIHGTHLPANGGRNLFDEAKDVLSRVDVACGNLEGIFLDGPGRRRKMTNPKTYFIFRMPPSYVDNLTAAGIDFMGMANNHVNDFGEPGRTSSMATMKKAGLAHAGLKGRCEIAVLERGGLKVALTQFGHGGNNLDVTDLDELRRVVKTMRDTADIVVVAFHGGAEGASHQHVPFKMETYVGEKRGNVAEFAHAAIDAGADVVYGHGPHVPRAAELYKGHIIFYSLGNFCTPYRMGIRGVSGYAPIAEIKIDADGKFISGKIHSMIQQHGKGPRKDATNAAAKLIKKLSATDFPASPLVIADDGTLSVAK